MMKKVRGLVSFLLVTVLLMSTAFSSSVFANNSISVEIDGQRVNFSDQQPVIVDNRTLVPVRGVFEQLGYTVSWEQSTQTATLSNGVNTVIITVGKSTFTMNGKAYSLDVPAQVINNRTMLPFRAVFESIGCGVDWDSSRNRVIVSSGGSAVVATTSQSTPNPVWETVTHASGTISEGIFDVNTRRLVRGKITFASGIISEGVFDKDTGRLVEGRNTFSNGTVQEGIFDKNTGRLITKKAVDIQQLTQAQQTTPSSPQQPTPTPTPMPTPQVNLQFPKTQFKITEYYTNPYASGEKIWKVSEIESLKITDIETRYSGTYYDVNYELVGKHTYYANNSSTSIDLKIEFCDEDGYVIGSSSIISSKVSVGEIYKDKGRMNVPVETVSFNIKSGSIVISRYVIDSDNDNDYYDNDNDYYDDDNDYYDDDSDYYDDDSDYYDDESDYYDDDRNNNDSNPNNNDSNLESVIKTMNDSKEYIVSAYNNIKSFHNIMFRMHTVNHASERSEIRSYAYDVDGWITKFKKEYSLLEPIQSNSSEIRTFCSNLKTLTTDFERLSKEMKSASCAQDLNVAISYLNYSIEPFLPNYNTGNSGATSTPTPTPTPPPTAKKEFFIKGFTIAEGGKRINSYYKLINVDTKETIVSEQIRTLDYSFQTLVESGNYMVEVSKEGYITTNTSVYVANSDVDLGAVELKKDEVIIAGKVFYGTQQMNKVNVSLINVETGEIVASSVTKSTVYGSPMYGVDKTEPTYGIEVSPKISGIFRIEASLSAYFDNANLSTRNVVSDDFFLTGEESTYIAPDLYLPID